MNQETSLLLDSPNRTWSFEKTTPFPATNGCYRSRIYTSNININPLVAACDQILSLAIALKTTEFPDNNTQFLQDLSHEIRSFEHHAQIANYQSNIIIAARYALCCLLDEIITQTEWSQTNNWRDKNLLTLFHNENDGSTRFFSIIDRSLENISTNLHLIELLYLCLNLGFVGKYQNTEHGQSELVAITNKLYQIIGHHNHLNRKNLLAHDSIPEPQQNQQTPTITANIINPKKLFGIAIALSIVISGLIYFGIHLKLNSISKEIHTTIEQLQKNNNEDLT